MAARIKGLLRGIVTLAILAIVVQCSSVAAPSTKPETQTTEGAKVIDRALVVVVGRAPDSLASKPLRDTGQSGSPVSAFRAFNAGLVVHDNREQPQPYLADRVPVLGNDSWRVSPDGRMETTYHLRSNLTWHDGHPLSADDFVFAWHVYSTPEFGLSASRPLNVMAEVLAADAQTLLIRWKQVSIQADDVPAADFPPLPRHILEQPFAQQSPDAFIANPFWLGDYVGLGPYRLRGLEMGSWVEGDAFEGHALGRPKIERIRFLAVPDPNVVVTTLLAGTAQVATDTTITDEQQAGVIERAWQPQNLGRVIRSPLGVRHPNVQLRPELASPPSLLDVRVRRALAHLTDRQSLADAVTEGLTPIADALILRELDYYPAVDAVITKYPFDQARADQLLREAGYALGGDGFYLSPTLGRFNLEIASPQGTRNESEITVMADGLRRVGIDAHPRVIQRVEVAQPLVTSSVPGFFNAHANTAYLPPIQWLRASAIAREETRFRGTNWSGFNDPEFERLVAAYETALDKDARTQHIVAMMKRISEEVPVYGLYYSLNYTALVSNLEGPAVSLTSVSSSWNLHEWHWTS